MKSIIDMTAGRRRSIRETPGVVVSEVFLDGGVAEYAALRAEAAGCELPEFLGLVLKLALDRRARRDRISLLAREVSALAMQDENALLRLETEPCP